MASVYNRGKKDRPNWWVKYKDAGGVWRRKATKQPTKEAAKRYASEVVARVARGIIGIPEREDLERPSLTVAELFERFLSEYHGPKIRDIRHYRAQRRSDFECRLLPYPLSAMEAQKLRLLDVERWREQLRGDNYAPGTINDSIQFLRLVFGWAVRRELVEGSRNPCPYVEKLPVQSLQEFYTLTQIHKILACEAMPVIVHMALYTGLRRGELSGLRWDDIDFEANRIHVKRSYDGPTKSGKARIVPLHRELRDTLLRRTGGCPPNDSSVINPIFVRGKFRPAREDDERMAQQLRELLARIGCTSTFERPWHAFRHTFATQFLEQGGSQAALERILGHSTSGNQITARYVHVDVAFLARELDRMTLLPPP